MKSQHDDRVDFIKGLLIALVILGHAYQNVVFHSSGNEVSGLFGDPVFKGIYLFHMPLFLMVSGYLTALRPPMPEDAGRFISRRAGRLILPALVWFFVIGLTGFLFVWFMLGRSEVPVFRPLVLLQDVLVQSWFVWCVFGFDLLVALLLKFRRANVLYLSIFCVASWLLPDFSIVFLFQYALPFLCLGYLFGAPFRRADFKVPSLWCVLAVILFLFIWRVWRVQDSVYLAAWSLSKSPIQSILLRFLGQAAASMCVLFVLLRLCHLKSLQRVLSWGRDSLGIYFLQTFLYSILPGVFFLGCSRLQLQVLCDTWYSRLGFALISAIIVMVLCLGLNRLLGRRRLSARLFLGRVS